MKRRKKGPAPFTEDSLLRVFSSARRPVGIDELESIFGRDRLRRRELMKMISSLVAQGRVIALKNKRFGLTKEMNLISGTLWCTRSGNGFVIPDSEGQRDVFVSSRNFNNAVHGDRVTVRLDHHYRGKPEGKMQDAARKRREAQDLRTRAMQLRGQGDIKGAEELERRAQQLDNDALRLEQEALREQQERAMRQSYR